MPINARTWPNPDPTQKSYYISAKTKIMYSVFMMQRQEDLWGPDDEYLHKSSFFVPLTHLCETCPRSLDPARFAFSLAPHTCSNPALEFDPDRSLDNRQDLESA